MIAWKARMAFGRLERVQTDTSRAFGRVMAAWYASDFFTYCTTHRRSCGNARLVITPITALSHSPFQEPPGFALFANSRCFSEEHVYSLPASATGVKCTTGRRFGSQPFAAATKSEYACGGSETTTVGTSVSVVQGW